MRSDGALTVGERELIAAYVSGLNANRIVRECLVGIAMRKKGITARDYLSPLTVEDNEPDR